jgi:hypothetical protein
MTAVEPDGPVELDEPEFEGTSIGQAAASRKSCGTCRAAASAEAARTTLTCACMATFPPK